MGISESRKMTGTRQIVVGVRVSEPRFNVIGNTSIDEIKEVLYFLSFANSSYYFDTILGHWRGGWTVVQFQPLSATV